MSEMTNTTGTEETIFMTPAATAEIKRIIEQQDNKGNLMLRVGVEGGGCSGLSYAMSFETEVGEFDKTFEFYGVKVVVDIKSLMYIGGTTIDFNNEILTGGFKFENPKSARGCGCGTSFSV